MTYDLYFMAPSPPCRSVLMVAKELSIDLNLKPVDLFRREHLSPEFLAMNPQHTLPTLVDHDEKDGDFILWESRAIQKYLIGKHAPAEHTLYPQSLRDRATIDRWLDFDACLLWPAILSVMNPVIRGRGPLALDCMPDLRKGMRILEDALSGGKDFLVGDCLTIADLSITASVSSIDFFDEGVIDVSEFANVKSWITRLRARLPYDQEVNQKGIDMINMWIRDQESKRQDKSTG